MMKRKAGRKRKFSRFRYGLLTVFLLVVIGTGSIVVHEGWHVWQCVNEFHGESWFIDVGHSDGYDFWKFNDIAIKTHCIMPMDRYEYYNGLGDWYREGLAYGLEVVWIAGWLGVVYVVRNRLKGWVGLRRSRARSRRARAS